MEDFPIKLWVMIKQTRKKNNTVNSTGLITFTPKHMLQILPIVVAQGKAGNI